VVKAKDSQLSGCGFESWHCIRNSCKKERKTWRRFDEIILVFLGTSHAKITQPFI
jgi:hypothetical protein